MKKYFLATEENDHKPLLLSRISAVILTSLIVLLLLFSVSINVVVNKSGFLSAVLPSVLVDLTNEARVENSYAPLQMDPKLTAAAKLKAQDMAQKEYFSHVSPEGVTPWYWIGLVDYKFIYAGENLAVNFSYSDDVNKAWLDSPGHAANIFNPNFTQIGIATAEGKYQGKDTIFVVQLFGQPAPQANNTVARAPVSSDVNQPEVKEAEIEVVEETVINENEKMIVVENKSIEIEEDLGVVEQEQAPGYQKYVPWYQWLILNPSKLTEYALYVAAGVILLAILISVMTKNTFRNPKGLAYGIFILVVLLLVIYLNRSGYITETLIEHLGS